MNDKSVDRLRCRQGGVVRMVRRIKGWRGMLVGDSGTGGDGVSGCRSRGGSNPIRGEGSIGQIGNVEDGGDGASGLGRSKRRRRRSFLRSGQSEE